MIHIATVHWKSDFWIPIQRRYLERNVGAPYRLYASLEGVDAHWQGAFDESWWDEGDHAPKLNALAQRIAERADPSDRLIFLDGDAFPVRPLTPRIDELLGEMPLAAVRRDENLGDRQPHPCFCATSVGFWTELGGDWREGSWTNAAGALVTDVGGRLLAQLEGRGVAWHPLLRSNRNNVHPLWCAVYGDLVYHHGAGFRRPLSRVDRDKLGPEPKRPTPVASGSRLARAVRQRILNRRYLRELGRYREREDALARSNAALMAEVVRQVESDVTFFERL